MSNNDKTPKFKDFSSFLDYCKEEAKSTTLDDIRKDNSEGYRILQTRKNQLNGAIFQSDINEVKDFAENATRNFQRYLSNIFTGGNYHKGKVPKLLIYAKMHTEYLNLYNEALNKNINGSKQKEKTVELKDFFNGVDQDTINAVQDEFKEYEGKRLAMLLHRLVDLDLVSYLPNSKTKARKHFVKLFKDEDHSLSYVNSILSSENELKKHPTDDPDYMDIKEKLSKALKKEVV